MIVYNKFMDNVTSNGQIPGDFYCNVASFENIALVATIENGIVLSGQVDKTFFAFGVHPWSWSTSSMYIRKGSGNTAHIAIVGSDWTEWWSPTVDVDYTQPIRILYSPIKKYVYINDTKIDITGGAADNFNSTMLTMASNNEIFWHGYGPNVNETNGLTYNAGYYLLTADEWPDYTGGGGGTASSGPFLDYTGLQTYTTKMKALIPKITKGTITLTSDGWAESGSGIAQSVTVVGSPFAGGSFIEVAPDPTLTYTDNWINNGVRCTLFNTETGALTFTCTTTPQAAINVNYVIVEVI